MNHTSRDVRNALADVVSRLEPLRRQLTLLSARAQRDHASGARQGLSHECEEIEQAIQVARTDMLMQLMDAPRPVAGHSRVVDVERAIDSLERSLRTAKSYLSADP